MATIEGHASVYVPAAGGGGGGEGPWVASSYGVISLTGCVTDDRWVCWANNTAPPTITGAAEWQPEFGSPQQYGTNVWILHITADGDVTLSRDSCAYWEYLIHKTAIGHGSVGGAW